MESPITYVFNFEDFKDVVMEGLNKKGQSIGLLKKRIRASFLFVPAFLVVVLIAYQFPKYSFLIVLTIVMFLSILPYIIYLIINYYSITKRLRNYEKSFEKIKYQKMTVTEETITIETDLETVTSKWQEVSDVVFREGVTTFKNGDSSYFFIERSVHPEHVIRLKEILSQKTAILH
jgi:hypothetical protein